MLKFIRHVLIESLLSLLTRKIVEREKIFYRKIVAEKWLKNKDFGRKETKINGFCEVQSLVYLLDFI